MIAEVYREELWEELKQALSNGYYLDGLRAQKWNIEPYYRVVLAIVSVVAAVVSFTYWEVTEKVAVIFTSLLATLPCFFAFLLPSQADFSKIDALRIELKRYLTELERLYRKDRDEASYNEFLKAKIHYSCTETELSALFGQIDRRMEDAAVKSSERYLERFTAL